MTSDPSRFPHRSTTMPGRFRRLWVAVAGIAALFALDTVTIGAGTAVADAPPDVQIAVSLNSINGAAAAPGASVTAGQVLVYMIFVTNSGASDANVVLTEWTPYNTTFDGPAAGPAAWSSAAGGNYTQTVVVPARSSGPVPFQVTVDSSLPPFLVGSIYNSVTAPGTNCAEEIDPPAAACETDNPILAWEVSKSADPPSGSQVATGSTITYTLTAQNTGGAPLTGAVVHDALDPGLTFGHQITSDPAVGTVKEDPAGSGLLTWVIGGPGGRGPVTIQYTATVTAGADSGDLYNRITTVSGGGSCGNDTHPAGPGFRSAAAGAFARDEDVPAGDTLCFTTHHTANQALPPIPPAAPDPAVTPGVAAQCILVGVDDRITVTTLARSGLAYTVTGSGTASVTVRASATSSDVNLNVPAGWTRNADGSVSVTLTPGSDGVVCEGSAPPSTAPAIPSSRSVAALIPPSSPHITVQPTSRTEPAGLAYTGVSMSGISALVLLLLVTGATLLLLGRAGRRTRGDH